MKSDYEDTLVGIVRRLPPDRVEQLVDFARFLEAQIERGYSTRLVEQSEIDEEKAGEREWDELLARPEAERALRDMAREAVEDYRSGKTTDIEITEDGRLKPA